MNLGINSIKLPLMTLTELSQYDHHLYQTVIIRIVWFGELD